MEGIVDGELKLALVEIIDEILAQDTACTKMNQGEKPPPSDSHISTDKTDWDAHSVIHHDIPDNTFQFDKNSLGTSIPAIDMYGQLLWTAAKRNASDNIANTDEHPNSAEIGRNEQPNISTETEFIAKNFESVPNYRPINSSPQHTYKTINPEQKPLGLDQANPNKLGHEEVASFGDNISDQNPKTFLKPDQERKLILILTKMFDAEFRKGNYPFNRVARNILQLLGEKFGSNVVSQISIEHLQGAYIGMSARYKNHGATQARDVIAIKNKNELKETADISKTENSYFKNTTQDTKIVYLVNEENMQHKHHGGNEIGKRGIQNSRDITEQNDPQTNTGTPNIPSRTTGNNVYPLSGNVNISEIPLESGSTTFTEFLTNNESPVNTVLRNSTEIDSTVQHQKRDYIKELSPTLVDEYQAESPHPKKYVTNTLNNNTEANEHLDAVDNYDTAITTKSSFIIANDVHKTLDQPVSAPTLPVENTTQNELDSTAALQNQAFNQLLSTNTLIPLDKACAARNRIKSKLEFHAAKVDPELLIDGATMAVAFIEAGIREYHAYTQIMINEFGHKIEPYLRDFYEGACHYLGLDCPKEYQAYQVRGGGC